jgi:hypothetical protein
VGRSFHEAFYSEFDALSETVQDEMLAHAKLLEQFGPQLGRPRVDTLKGSPHANMKELRFDADDGVWRVAFAFDPKRKAILLVAGDQSGGSEKRFYPQLIAKADKRFDGLLARLKKKELTVKTLNQKMKRIGSARRRKIEARAAGLIAEQARNSPKCEWPRFSALVRMAFPVWKSAATFCFPHYERVSKPWAATCR